MNKIYTIMIVKIYRAVVWDHLKSFSLTLPGYYISSKQAAFIASREKENNPYIGSIGVHVLVYDAKRVADLLNG